MSEAAQAEVGQTGNPAEPSTGQLKRSHAQLCFIHQVLSQRTQYFVEEFEVARDSIRTITEMANKLGDQIQSIDKAAAPQEATPEAGE